MEKRTRIVRPCQFNYASEYMRKHEVLGKVKGQTTLQRFHTVQTFEKQHEFVSWRVRISDVSWGEIDCRVIRPSFGGDEFEIPLKVDFGSERTMLETLNIGDICIVTGTPQIKYHDEKDTLYLYLHNATIKLA